jgi:hypothetical protein
MLSGMLDVKRFGLTILIAGFVTTSSYAQIQGVNASRASQPIRVLFIGNSLTYFNNLPKMLEVIAASQKAGPHIATEAVLKGGERLQGHWEAGNAVAAIRKGGWDYVVLQESSTLGHRVTQGTPTNFDDASAYLAHARRFDEEIRKVGAQTVLYATWASQTQPELQRNLMSPLRASPVNCAQQSHQSDSPGRLRGLSVRTGGCTCPTADIRRPLVPTWRR